MKYLMKIGLLLLFLSSTMEGKAIVEQLPKKIVISDFSMDEYTGIFEYNYELQLEGEEYKLFRTRLMENNFKRKKEKTKRKCIKKISSQLISELLTALQNPKDSLDLQDLGYSYEWFNLNNEQVYRIAQKLWEKRWPDSPDWNTRQSSYIKTQLKDPAILAKAVQREFLNEGYVTLHSSGNSLFKMDLIFDDKTISIESGQNYLGLPWIVNQQQQLYNLKISKIMDQLLPKNKGFNKSNLEASHQQEILEAIIDQAYQDDCERKVKLMTFYNYEEEIEELKSRYKLWGFREQRSATNNWDFEHRLFMYAQDSTEKRNIRFGINLTIEGNTLYTRDSILKKADRYHHLVQQVPFLLRYLEGNPKRWLDIAFDNGNSLSKKVKESQSGEKAWKNGICLSGATEEYLNNCVAFVLRDEKGNGSNWLITPELDVILIYYQHHKVYHYTDEDLGLEGPSIRYACQHFELDGRLKINSK